jgi:hypothetical protein
MGVGRGLMIERERKAGRVGRWVPLGLHRRGREG